MRLAVEVVQGGSLAIDVIEIAHQILDPLVLGLFEQMHDFARGVVDTRAVVFYVSATLFFLFLTRSAVPC